MSERKKTTILSVLPLLAFVAIFLGSGIYFNDFYLLPTPLVALAGVFVALLAYRAPLTEKINIFFKGAGNSNVLIMCVIMLFAGAFAAATKASGSVDSIVNLGINYISPAFFPIEIFLIASFLSFSTGTSVGTITTLAPIALGLATQSDFNISLIAACLLSGAMFGDNLSLISDTTIAATQTMGCKMNEKMKANVKIALPAALAAVIILLIIGNSQTEIAITAPKDDFNIMLILPYVSVVVLSLFGVNVFASLLSGIFFSGVLGMAYGKFTFLEFTNLTYQGFSNMSEIFFLFFFTGGLAALVEHFGGIRFLIDLIRKPIQSGKRALLGMGVLVSAVNFCVANNTVSILIVSRVCRELKDRFPIRSRDAASVLDIFSCYVQGVIPYGAQVLAIVELSQEKVRYPELVGYSVYLHLLLISTLIYIFIYKGRKKGATPHENVSDLQTN
ncbi:Na+/H+ antiporter NhaC family protein [Capnocytophaga sp.]|uniref:Na+/H+ antiporter NhaC family protein n=1 Tax=Capnocytophaga sp. TaxID=44737 RepID=UPI0026DA7235|nr:Na+/H+ antiporter NhaC family protein [Capnocytophaga sp.]MDO5104604.1 Na+/H+ antiporter NhaC family protein [Capnocytophaga sp.]